MRESEGSKKQGKVPGRERTREEWAQHFGGVVMSYGTGSQTASLSGSPFLICQVSELVQADDV